LSDQPLFRLLHPPLVGSSPIIIAGQVKHPMHNVSDYLALPGCAKALGLDAGFINTDEDLTSDIRFAVVESNYVSGTFMPYINLIELRYLRLTDQENPELKSLFVQEFANQRPGDAP
jgi:hypothetical protein